VMRRAVTTRAFDRYLQRNALTGGSCRVGAQQGEKQCERPF
jgi:hypothetical protein